MNTNLIKKVAFAAVASTAAGAAMADGIDVTAVVTTIQGITAAVVSIGVAVLAVTATIFGYKYLRKVM
ncbi:major capsid protein [Chromobacterium sp. IIBBL 290-4]|uniref:major capsid protein n=1 Tax=Chromobacterium sp. IIBBL 290-4 TaxID=2953890 RepID=UPI0020B6EB62|nr:major capsid protein [Chromobacterium sp. IIBBL 290-4]UTH73571.1 major capsid protein [Chromobacterium sp. IIBBL 290-4]